MMLAPNSKEVKAMSGRTSSQKRRKKRRNRCSQAKRTDTNSRRKLSELVWEFAGDFIRMGDSMEEKESLLNAACSAWNIACTPPDMQQRQIDQYMRAYSEINPHADEAEIAKVHGNIEKLISKKAKMFPGDLRQIVGARILNMGDKDRIEVVSASVP
jgi:hypothetical protein